jgi:hypothetical protein
VGYYRTMAKQTLPRTVHKRIGSCEKGTYERDHSPCVGASLHDLPPDMNRTDKYDFVRTTVHQRVASLGKTVHDLHEACRRS